MKKKFLINLFPAFQLESYVGTCSVLLEPLWSWLLLQCKRMKLSQQ